ncbi:peptidoglycan DD-metalloendopeptidase family protein [Maricaulaceae bacterium MS644]
MSGFDVKHADARRSRTLAFFLTLTGVLLFTFALLILRNPSPGEARAASPVELELAADLATGADAVVTAGGLSGEAPAPALMRAAVFDTGRALIEAEHALFTDATWRPQVSAHEITVSRGQTFASVLDAAGASRLDAARAIAALEPLFSARNLRAGQSLTVFMETPTLRQIADDQHSGEARLAGFSFRPDSDRTLTVARMDDNFRAREAAPALERQLVRARGEVDSSLYVSALEVGATDRIVVELAGILGYAVDFRTIQPGDAFDVVFERFVNRRGETVRTGEIVYLVFDGRGDALEYFRFEAPDGEIGYYTSEGESARRLLMKMPINGARISSNFGMRFHPVLQTNRAHNGTDFAAPRGTPIMAAGAGVVARANRFGSFGNYIRIQHANGYETAYAHLNGFARGIRAGARVQQGQTIGYVGTTGRSTGPHLHYEVHLNGRPTNPLALDLPTGKTLSDGELALFAAERERIVAIRDAARPADGSAPPETSLVAELDADNT